MTKDSKNVSSYTFGNLKKIYLVYILIGFPNSVIRSSNLTACVIQIKIENNNEVTKKIFKNSDKKYLNILFLNILNVINLFK